MADLYSSDLGVNTRKVTPTDQLGTRRLAYLMLEITDLESGYTDSNSTYSKAIRFVQQNAEIYSAGLPNGNVALLLVNADSLPETTNPDHPSRINDGTSRCTYLEDVLDNSGISATVWNVRLNGDNLTYDC
jgi:hypothetical protein